MFLLDVIEENQNSLFAREAKTKSLWSPPQLKSPKEIFFKKKTDGKIISNVINMWFNFKSVIFSWKLNFGNGISLKIQTVKKNKISKKELNKFRFLR